MNSCLYEGSVRHRRHGSPEHEFHHRLFMAYLDLDELPEIFDGRLLWSARRPALAWFRREDHLGDPQVGLAEAVRALVLERTGVSVEGPIRLLTHLRYFGHCFNPVSFYYCYEQGGEHVKAVVAHVTNTPWGESHSYVLAVQQTADHGSAQVIDGRVQKELHVSPLMGMNHTYRWRLTQPEERLAVHIQSLHADGSNAFDATLALKRTDLSGPAMARALVRFPMITVGVLVRIYTHALALKLRGAHYHPHPNRGAPST